MTSQQFLNAIAALLAWREEAVNGLNGQIAVLMCIRNRQEAGWSHGDLGAIMESHNQFSSMSVPGDGQLTKYPSAYDPTFQKLLQIVDQVFSSTNPLPDTYTNSGLYYADLSSPGFQHGGWFSKTILANPTRFPRTAQIGTTTYFGDRGEKYQE